MHNQKYVFSQLLDFLDRNAFNYLARKYDGDKYVKQFTCYNQLTVFMFGQLCNRESLRDVVLATHVHAKKALSFPSMHPSTKRRDMEGGKKVAKMSDTEIVVVRFSRQINK